MKIQHIVISFIGICLFVFVVGLYKAETGCDDQSLVVATSFDYPPYTFMDKNQIVGFDIDLIKAVAQRMEKKIKVVGLPFEGLIFGLLSGDVNVIASGMSPTERRRKFVFFSDSYLSGDGLVIVYKQSCGALRDVDSLIGKTVVVNTGFVADTYMSSKKGVNLIRLKTPAEALMALKCGTVDAWVCAQSSAQAFLAKISDSSEYEIALLQGTGDDYAFVVQRNDCRLAHEINEALQGLRKDGTIEQLKEKWNIV